MRERAQEGMQPELAGKPGVLASLGEPAGEFVRSYRDRKAVTGMDWSTVRVTPPKSSSRSQEWL